VNTCREWSDEELNELGVMLVHGVPLEEIAHRLRRDHGDVQDKVIEIGRACRVGWRGRVCLIARRILRGTRERRRAA
jgi:hypothetical protein